MKKCFLLIAILSIAISKSYSQSIENLDSKFGFQNFKLNTLKSQFNSSELLPISDDTRPNIQEFIYMGSCCKNIGSVDVFMIKLYRFNHIMYI